MHRIDSREYDKIRDLRATFDVFEFAPGSVLLELGKTKILCSVTLNSGVPRFLKGLNSGWLTADYAMLPASTHKRVNRDPNKLNGRSVEISRLIGRTIRSVSDLSHLGEKTINIDCDVMQADGGTRTASIIAAYLALKKAQDRLLQSKDINLPILKDEIAAISTGISDGNCLLDLNFEEDSKAQIDLNFVLAKDGKLVELQGTAESDPIDWQDFDKLRNLAIKGTDQVFEFYKSLNI
jgi:ribonuclease PH